jgi:hypothetical protein
MIVMAHPKSQEPPQAQRVPKPGEELTKEELEFLQDKVAKWWIPADVVFLEGFRRRASASSRRRSSAPSQRTTSCLRRCS